MRSFFYINIIWLITVCCTSLFSAEPQISPKEAMLLNKTEALPPEEAMKLLHDELKKSPSPVFYFALGALYAKAGDNSAAQKAFMDAVNVMPIFHRARLNAVKMMIITENFAEAISNLTRLLASDHQPQSELWFLLSQCHFHQNNLIAAEAAAKNSIALNGTDKNGKLLLLKILASQPGKIEEAAALAQQELTANPNDMHLWSLWSAAMLETNRSAAMAILECAKRFNAASDNMLSTLTYLFLEEELYLPAYQTALPLLHNNALSDDVISILIQKLQENDFLQEAKSLLDSLPEKLQKASNIQQAMARQAALSGDRKSAREILQSLLKQHPLDGTAIFTLARLHEEDGNINDAMHVLSRAELIDDLKYTALLELARLAVEKNDYKAALDFTIKAQNIKNSPDLEKFAQQIRKMQ